MAAEEEAAKSEEAIAGSSSGAGSSGSSGSGPTAALPGTVPTAFEEEVEIDTAVNLHEEEPSLTQMLESIIEEENDCFK